MKMKTRTHKLAAKIQKIYEQNKTEINALPTIGPKGGKNARFIDGWTLSPHGTISRAAGLTDMPMMNFWSGFMPTPSTAVPACVYDELLKAYNDIF